MSVASMSIVQAANIFSGLIYKNASELVAIERDTTHVEGRNNTFGNSQSSRDGVNTVKQWLLVLLQILVVGGRHSLEGHHESGHLTECSTGFASKQLERVGVLLLGHDGGSSTASLVRNLHVTYVGTHLYASLRVTKPNSALL